MSFGTLDDLQKAEEATKLNEALESIHSTSAQQFLTLAELLDVVKAQVCFTEEFAGKIDILISVLCDQDGTVPEDVDMAKVDEAIGACGTRVHHLETSRARRSRRWPPIAQLW